jgi:tetratricopeptide (TPR) repeat protein
MRMRSRIKFVASALVFWVMSCTLIVSSPAGELEVNQEFSAANQAYEAGKWSKAVAIYEGLIREAGFSASLCYNLANSYVRNGQTGKAVLGYERALFLAPGDADIRANLERLRQEKGLFPEETPLLHQAGTLFGLNQWSLAAAFFLVAVTLLHLATLRFVIARKPLLLLTLTGLLVFGLCSFGAVSQYQRWQQAVIVAPAARLLLSPFDGAQVVGEIAEGRLVAIGKNHVGFTLIKDEDGRSGWISDASLERLAVDGRHKEP